MYFKGKKHNEQCEVHGHSHRSVNKALAGLLFAAILLIIWHVWAFGPSNPGEKAGGAFPVLLGREIWDIIFDRYGLIAQFWSIFPYFMIGILLAALIRTYKWAIKLRQTISRHGFLSIFVASMTGIMTPLCACGTITTAFSLLVARVPLAPVMSLMVTSALMSPTAFILTINDLGPQWAAIRVIAALLMGIFAGLTTWLLRKNFQPDTVFIEGAIAKGDFHDEDYPDERLKCTCSQRFGNRVARKTNNKFVIWLAKSAEMLWPVGKYILVGVFIGTIAERYMPYSWMYKLFGQGQKFGIVWVTLAAIPVFLHQISVSSILFHVKSALNGTMSGGAGLAFLIGGPVTAVPTLAMLWSACRKKVFFLYMAVCIVGTITISYAFQYFVFVPYVDTDNPLLRGVKTVSGGPSAVLTRTDDKVRMVMDPGGKGMIAVRYDYIDGQGNMVFDSGPDRFLASADYSNAKYIGNVAKWLGQGGNATGNILVYDASDGQGSGEGAFARYATLLAAEGFHLKLTDREQTPRITGKLLENYSQLWIFSGGLPRGGRLTSGELSSISGFVGQGGGVLVVPEDAAGLPAANAISSPFGVRFSGAVQHKPELTVSASFYFLAKMAGLFKSALSLTHKA